MNPSYFIWSQNGTMLRGYANENWVPGNLVFPVGFPGMVSPVQSLTLQSSASAQGSLETFNNVKFYLTGDPADLALVQGSWPTLGSAYTPARTDLNGGFEISFDGSNYTRFSNTVGLASDPTTWITLPAIATGSSGANGVLGAYDTAQIFVRYAIPSSVTTYKTLNIQLAVDADIL